MQVAANSIDKEKAISLATISNEFQSKVQGYRYVFSSIFTNMTENQEKCGDVKLTSIAVEFSVLNNTSNFVKFVQVGEDPTISQVTFVEDVYVQKCDNNCPPPSPPANNPVQEILSPLRQIAGGIAPKDVTCRDNLVLVLKAEDDSPACVKPEHLTRLSQYGWTIPNLKIIGDTDITNNGLSENDCGQFHTISENKSNSNEIPVLILKQNSTGCAKITFTINFLFNNTNDCVGCNSQMVKTAEFLSIGKYNFSRHGDLISGSSGKDYTHSFQITSVPKIVDVSKYPIGSNFTAVFIIKPLPNATGFYDYSIVKPVCNAYPLAVGYSPDQVHSSDFSEGLSFMQNHPCVMGSYGYSQVQVSGIDYVQMKLD